MMAFITRSSAKPEPARWLVWLALAISLWLVALPSRAEGINPRLASLALQDGYLVANTRFAIQLNPTLSDALDEGVPLAFRLQFRLNRPRLYAWWQQLSGGFEPTAEQQYKLSFHSLTQTWRVSVQTKLQAKRQRHAFVQRVAEGGVELDGKEGIGHQIAILQGQAGQPGINALGAAGQRHQPQADGQRQPNQPAGGLRFYG
jgi:hypothetical protein